MRLSSVCVSIADEPEDAENIQLPDLLVSPIPCRGLKFRTINCQCRHQQVEAAAMVIE